MSRTLAILKYLPAVLCGLLAVAWVVSLFGNFYVTLRWLNVPPGYSRMGIGFGSSALYLFFTDSAQPRTRNDPAGKRLLSFGVEIEGQKVLLFGAFKSLVSIAPTGRLILRAYDVPIPFLLTLVLPLSIAPFTRFRFPLWSTSPGRRSSRRSWRII